jgi:site-specific recombinase XerD
MDLATAIQEHTETAPGRRTGLARFLADCRVDDTRWLTPAHSVAFLQTLLDQGLAPLTIHGYRSAANAFFRWLLDQGLVSFDGPALKQAFDEQAALIPKEPRAQMEAPAEEDVRRLVEAAQAALPTRPADTLAGQRQYLLYLRNIAIVETLRATGIRPGELVQLRLCDLDQAQQAAQAPDGRLLYFDLESWGALTRYLVARGDPVDRPLLVWQAPVFARHDSSCTRRGPLPMHHAAVGNLIRTLRSSEALTCRSLRRRFGQRLLAATGDERGTAKLLGIKRPKNARPYRRQHE